MPSKSATKDLLIRIGEVIIFVSVIILFMYLGSSLLKGNVIENNKTVNSTK